MKAILVESRMTGHHLLADLLPPGTASDDNGRPCMSLYHDLWVSCLYAC